LRARVASVRVEIDRPSPGSTSGAGASGASSVRFRLVWVLDDGQWLLDGGKTLQSVGSTIPPVAKPPPPETAPEKKVAPARKKKGMARQVVPGRVLHDERDADRNGHEVASTSLLEPRR
jgi:hypothetical protein